jgi:hypothetical protein
LRVQDRVTGLHSPVKTRKSGQEGHRKRRRVAEAQGWRLAGGEELACNGVAAFAASVPARCDPAAITVQAGHGGHRVADLKATHTMSHGDHHASEIKTENDGGTAQRREPPRLPGGAGDRDVLFGESGGQCGGVHPMKLRSAADTEADFGHPRRRGHVLNRIPLHDHHCVA